MSTTPAKQSYRKHYIPLESNPEIFTELIHKLGVSSALEFVDIYSIDDPELLAFVPRPVYALMLVFPTDGNYDSRVRMEETARRPYSGKGDDEKVIWFKQTINNACGLYGILHAVSNGDASRFIGRCAAFPRNMSPPAPLCRCLRAIFRDLILPSIFSHHSPATDQSTSTINISTDPVGRQRVPTGQAPFRINFSRPRSPGSTPRRL